MTFAIKYRMNFNSVLDDPAKTVVDWEVDIELDGYSGPVIPVTGTADPLNIRLDDFDNVFEPICTTNATVNLFAETNDQFIEFQSAEVFQYALTVKKDSAIFWKGVYMTEPYREQFTNAPYSVSLKFNDGLAELQYERFEDSGVIRSDFNSVIDIMTKCFSFLPFTRKTRELINVFEDNMIDGDTRGLLEQLQVFEAAFWEIDHDDDVHGENCLEVLRGLMESLGCRLIVSQDIWYVIRIGEMFDSSIKFVEYDTAGAVSTNSTIDLRQFINKTATGASLLRHMAGGNNTISREYQEVKFSYSSKNIATLNNNILINWNFDNGFELEGTSVVPKHYTRSAAINTQLGIDPNGLHLGVVALPGPPPPPGGPPNIITDKTLIFEDSLLLKTKITVPPKDFSSLLQPIDPTRESYNLTPESPADSSVTWKNLLTDDSDHLQIRIKGHFDYKVDANDTSHYPLMFNKWTIKLGSNFYNIATQTWDTTDTNRVYDNEWGDYHNDNWSTLQAGSFTRRHEFDKIINLANFPSDSTDDLTVTWFVPENTRSPNSFGTNDGITEMEIVFEQMQIRYVSSNSTEFELQKVLGETGSNTLRRKSFTIEAKHGDGPSAFSVRSFRLPTTNLITSTWSTRGGAEALEGFKILIINPIFENVGKLRQVFNGPLYGLLEPHNTVSGIDGKVFAIKGWDYKVKKNQIIALLHEVGVNPVAVIFNTQFALSASSAPTDSGGIDINPTETQINAGLIVAQGFGLINTSGMSVAPTQVVRANNDTSEDGEDYPL